MIREAAVKVEARRLGVDPLVVDRDHALGVVLSALAHAGLEDWGWVFKGGTCLRKAHFASYRFSEDLDFTCLTHMGPEDIRHRMSLIATLAESLGTRLLLDRVRIDDKSGGQEVSLEIKVPYEGTVRRSGPPANLQLHLSFGETLAFPVASRPLLHPYADAHEVTCVLACYSLEEILVEKLRAVCGQRRFAIARDLYDIWMVTAPVFGTATPTPSPGAVDVEGVLRALPGKAGAVGVDLTEALERLDARREEYRANWAAAVAPLAPRMAADAFDHAWQAVRTLVERVDQTAREASD